MRSGPLLGPAPAAKTTASAPCTISSTRCNVAALEIEHDRLGAVGAHVVAVVGIAQQRDGLVAGGGEAAAELTGDLAVASDDDDTHPVS